MKVIFKKTAIVLCIITALALCIFSASAATGDLDGNGQVDANDAIYLLMHTFFEDDYPVTGNADFDKSGKIDANDAIYLLMNTFFEEDYPLECEHTYVDCICSKCGEIQPTADDYFIFTELSDGNYSIKAKNKKNMPTHVIIPDTYNGKTVTTIEENAFSDCRTIKVLIISDSVKYINSSAFSKCSNITSLTIGKYVKGIRYSAFAYCYGLTEINYNAIDCGDLPATDNRAFLNAGTSGAGITVKINKDVIRIPASLFSSYTTVDSTFSNSSPKITSVEFEKGSVCKSIGEYAFFNCKYIQSITIPTSVTEIDNSVFGYCQALTSVTIPNSITSISKGMFMYCTALTSITIPDSVTSIGGRAFYNCFYLENVTISKNLKTMDYDVFLYCRNLKNINLPNGLTNIGSGAFEGCNSLESITIPESIKTIEFSAFKDCSNLKEIHYDAIECSDISSDYNPFKNAGDANVGVKMFVGSNVKRLPDYLFYYSSLPLVSVEFEAASVCESIGSYTFYYCSKLTTINLPDSISNIGNYAFYGCSNLAFNIYDNAKYLGNEQNKYLYLFKYVSQDITSVNIHDTTKIIGDQAFSDCSALADVIIGNSVVSIGDYAFSSCYALKSVIIPHSVKSIGQMAFSGCQALESVSIPHSLNSIGWDAFYYCNNLKSVYISDIRAWCDIEFSNSHSNPLSNKADLYLNGELCTELALPDGITELKNYAFYGCQSLQSISIPDSITRIDYGAFSDCTSLTNITISGSVTSIGNSIFQKCDKITFNVYDNAKYLGNEQNKYLYLIKAINEDITCIDIHPTTTYIFEEAFQGCRNLTVINIPSSVTSIGNYAFASCGSLTTVNIPDTVTFIGDSVFSSCNNLTNVTIGNGVTSIGSYAFSGCANLNSINIPNNIISIGNDAFSFCSRLNYIYYNATACEDLPQNTTLFDNAGYYGNGIKVVIGANVKRIPDYLFYTYADRYYDYSPNITSIEFEEGSVCTEIGKYAFIRCYNLTSITLPNSITSIGDYAFSNCTNLVTVNIPDCVTSIGEFAFGQCEQLTSIRIPSNIAYIGPNAFSSCSNLSFYAYDSAVYLGNEQNNYLYLYKAVSQNIDSIEIHSDTKIIRAGAFSNCQNLTEVTIPEGVIEIQGSAFSGCTRLNIIKIPASLVSVGHSSFYNCYSLNVIYYPGNYVQFKNIVVADYNTEFLRSAKIYNYVY